jgi:deferrochelatase/peroxidase EfeB
METRPTNTPEAAARLPVLAQAAVTAPLTRTAIFLVATLNPGSANRATLRSFCGDLTALVRAVEFRDLEGGLSCIMGFGSDAWDHLFGRARPAELHPFREIRAETAKQRQFMAAIKAYREAKRPLPDGIIIAGLHWMKVGSFGQPRHPHSRSRGQNVSLAIPLSV